MNLEKVNPKKNIHRSTQKREIDKIADKIGSKGVEGKELEETV